MKKRPLSMAALIVVIFLWLLPEEIWMQSPPSGSGPLSEKKVCFERLSESSLQKDCPADVLAGEICQLEEWDFGQTVYLKNTTIPNTEVILVYLKARQDLAIGNTLLIKQPYTLNEPERPGNPGQFDAHFYYQTQKIGLICYAEKAKVVDASEAHLPQMLYELREILKARNRQIFGGKESGLMNAMILGDKSGIPKDVKSIYSQAGISHIISLSGLHLSLVGMSLYRVLRKLGCAYWTAGFPTMILVWLYGMLTGMGTSTARAVIMCLLVLIADVLGKSYDMLTALAFAAILLLAEQPLYARNAAFLLSFGAVLGIGSLYPALKELFPFPQKLLQTCLLNIAIQAMTFPILQFFYYECARYSIALNLIVVPLMGVLLPAGIFTLGSSFVSMRLAEISALLCTWILHFFEWTGEKSLQLPGAVFPCGQPERWQMVVYYLGIAGFLFWRARVHEKEKNQEQMEEVEERLRKQRVRRERMASVSLFLILSLVLSLRPAGVFRFTMLDVGQGSGLFLQTEEGINILIDGGSSDVEQVGTYRLVPFLKSQGVDTLHFVFLTHLDQDHISGVEEILGQMRTAGGIQIESLVLPKGTEATQKGNELRNLAEKKETAVRTFEQGNMLQIGKTRLTCLHPGPACVHEDSNEGSLVLQVEYGEVTILVPGDLGEEGEQELWKEGLLTDCDILVAGHHGSRFSTSEAWLEKLQPEVALISCGEGNAYGHPHPETVERLKKTGTVSLTTPEYGAITIHSDGENFSISHYILKSTIPRSSHH